MTRKHFIEIAAILKQLKQEPGTNEYTLRYAAIALAGVFKRLNPNFDKERFLAACGF